MMIRSDLAALLVLAFVAVAIIGHLLTTNTVERLSFACGGLALFADVPAAVPL
ncbi:MAG: hypothetical protein WA439_21390 [Pseudolabrys sp.]